MKRNGKRLWAVGLCLCLLLGLTACGEADTEKSDYQKAMDAIKEEDYQTAYDLLIESKDRRAAEELEKFTFVPVSMTDKASSGRDETLTYTYDSLGNLLTSKCVDTSGELLNEYTYSGYKKISHRHISNVYSYGSTFTYDADGRLVMERFLDRSGNWLGQTTYTYDEQGRCLSEETARMEEAQDLFPELESTHYYTYDAEGRILVDRETYYYAGEISENYEEYYTYEADGSYCLVKTIDEGAKTARTLTAYYDAQGREIRGQWQFNDEEEPYVDYECRYNERGEMEYEYRRCYEVEEVTTFVYDDRGNLLEKDTTDPEGEPIYMLRSTYDDRGNQLTEETVWLEINEWSKNTFTYDDQNRVLTHKRSHTNGWADITYTYDAQGNKIAETKEGSNYSYSRTYEYDEWGNVTASFQYSTYNGTETAYDMTFQWEVRYYPKGVPQEVQTAINTCTVD